MDNNEKNNQPNNEPIVLGYLRKEKSSKPAFVLIIFLFIIGICLGLPYIQDYLKNSNNFISDLYNTYFGEDDSEDKIIITNDTIHSLSNLSTIRYDNLYITNINFVDGQISYFIKVVGEDIKLDEMPIYFEIYGSNNNLLKRIKLTGVATDMETIREMKFTDFKFNESTSYYGRMRTLVDTEYPEVTSNILTCKDEYNEYIYNFNNFQLERVQHKYLYFVNSNLEMYLSKLSYYQELVNVINAIEGNEASVAETESGLEFNADLILTDYTALGAYNNYNYYIKDKTAKQINYEMQAKGFDCK